MPADIILYGLVAAGLALWLRSVLGTRTGQEHERPNPLTPSPAQRGKTPFLEPVEAAAGIIKEETPQHPALAQANPAVRAAIDAIARAEREFDISHFLTGAQDAFALIVEAFAAGSRETLKGLLLPAVYESFERAITEREAKGHKAKTEIHAIRKAEILEAKLEGRQAFITLRFTADETAVIYDRDGKILEGNPERVHEMHDVWIFTRNLKSRDPRWLLAETRGDFEGDNQMIPNSV